MVLETIVAYDAFAYDKFFRVFDSNGFFVSKIYSAIKLDLEVLVTFITSPEHAVVFDKFKRTAEQLCLLKAESSLQDKHKRQILHLNYVASVQHEKLKRLIENNSVLKSHYGLPLVLANRDICDYKIEGDVHYICKTHCKRTRRYRIDPPAYESVLNEKRKADEVPIEFFLDFKKIKTAHLDSPLCSHVNGGLFQNRF